MLPSAALVLAIVSLASPQANAPSAGPGDRSTDDAPSTMVPSPEVEDPLQLHTDRVDHDAVERGLTVRVGERWRSWTIDVDDAAAPSQVDVRLTDETGRMHTRSLTLHGETRDERSRELAAALALLVEQIEQARQAPSSTRRPPTEPTPSAEPPPTGWLGLGPRIALNPARRAHVEGGVSLGGGAWLVREQLQPVATLGWARSRTGDVRVDALRLGAGLLGGAPLAGDRLWAGGGALLRAQWARAASVATASGWWASPAILGALQYRGRVLVAGVWLGVDLSLPPLRARGAVDTVRWGPVRPMAALQLGIRLPPRPNAP